MLSIPRLNKHTEFEIKEGVLHIRTAGEYAGEICWYKWELEIDRPAICKLYLMLQEHLNG